MLFALFADRSNSQFDFCGKGPLFIERVTNNYRIAGNFQGTQFPKGARH